MGVAYFNDVHIRNEVDIETDATKPNEVAIHSSDWENPNSQTGFGIMGNGDAYFNNGKFRGIIEATSGTFNGTINAKEGVLQSVIILGDSTFSGDIFSGPLELSSTKPSGAIITIPAGLTRKTGYRLSHGVGTYKGFSFIEMWISTDNDLDRTGDYAKLNLYNGSDYYTEKGEKGTGRLPDKVLFKFTDTLTFQYAVASDAKTFKLKNLPTVKPSESGTVWNNNGVLNIS